jgi:signal transduction histidine kinase
MPVRKISLPTQIDLENFISVQAHDLRTPFNHIIGFSKMTLNTVSDAPLTALQKEDLGTVYRSGLRALTLMNGLIDIARLNRHEKKLNPTDVNIDQLMEQGLAQWKKFNPASEVEVEWHTMGALPSLHADEQVLRQVITGFIAYVVQYCEGKAKVAIQVEQAPGQTLFTFTSSGTRSRLPSGLDLELLGYINRAFIELHSGEILQSEENDQGAVIKFSITSQN